ncbi:MAG: geranylgeranyl reductase family protein [Limnospira sp.]
MFDCIIVGTGPAGATAAYHLAKKGHSILAIDKAILPRYKPCGGGVSPVVQDGFDFDLSPAISLKTNTVCFTFKKGDPAAIDLKNHPIWMVRREVFDYFILNQAVGQGAAVRDHTEVTSIEFKSDRWFVNTTKGQYCGRYLIAADGSKGSMAKCLGFKKQKKVVAGALELEIPRGNRGDNQTYFEFGLVNKGYAWNFPKADGFSVGAGAFWKERKAQNFKQILIDYAQMFDLNLDGATECGHPIAVWDGSQKLHAQNALLAGEAACVVDPFTAEGIRPSIFSGLKAAAAIHDAIAGNMNALERYTEIMVEEWGKEMLWAQKLAQIFYRFPQLSYQVGVKHHSAAATMSRIFAGELSYSDVANKGIDLIRKSVLKV